MKRRRSDWPRIEAAYRAGVPAPEIARRFAVSPASLRRRRVVEGWDAPLSARQRVARLLEAQLTALEAALAVDADIGLEQRLKIVETAGRLAERIARLAEPTGEDATPTQRDADEPPIEDFRDEIARRIDRLAAADDARTPVRLLDGR